MFKLNDYVQITELNSKDSLILEAVGVCKRMNNKKRDFLFVNRHQGKHFPVSPNAILEMYHELSDLANTIFLNERIAIVGFSETATAIAHYMASELNNCHYVIKTTREVYDNKIPLIEFKEVHSHAQTHLLYGDLEKLIRCERIVFVEDEITTGNTIMNFIKAFNKINAGQVQFKYGVISILNWQSEQDAQMFECLGIPTVCLLRGNLIQSNVKVPNVVVSEHVVELFNNMVEGDRFGIIKPSRFKKQSAEIGNLVFNAVGLQDCFAEYDGHATKNILVIGTEEFMYLPLQIANFIEKKTNADIIFHATTRSPIIPNKCSDEYAINTSEVITSPYADRETYIYNLKRYDKVIIITDAPDVTGKFKQSMIKSLTSYGNIDISFIRLVDKKGMGES